ncbi:MAG: energy coupling factor transporter S component ThiW [Oliverpabstia sp.]
MEKQRLNTFRMVMLAMMVAIGVVISPILRIEGMCPTAHLINIVCSVLMGPWYSLLCATMIGVIRMLFMGIPPLALTGAVFGAFLSGVFYRLSGGKIICAVLGEIFGTGIIGSLVSYPVMAFIMGRDGLNAFFYTSDVYLSNDHGWRSSICVPESTEQSRTAGKISEKSWSKSL